MLISRCHFDPVHPERNQATHLVKRISSVIIGSTFFILLSTLASIFLSSTFYSSHIQSISFQNTTIQNTSISIVEWLAQPRVAFAEDTTTEAGIITGTVFRDFDSNGLRDVDKEPPLRYVDGITVTAYDGMGVEVGQTDIVTTTGQYSLNVTGTGPYRVEFSGLPDYLYPGVHTSGTTVQFVADGTVSDINLAVQNPEQYCEDDPHMAVACYETGSGNTNSNPSLVSFPYSATDRPEMYGGTAQNPRVDTTIDEIGSIWGMAFQASTRRLFAASFTKRHMGFKDGPSYIYFVDYSTPQSGLIGSLDLQGIVPQNSTTPIDLGMVCRGGGCENDPGNTGIETDYSLPDDTLNTPSIDLDAFAKVSKTSFGDIEVTEDSESLWLVNAYQRALISVTVASGLPSTTSDFYQYMLDDLVGIPVCNAGVFRPWAIEFNDGRGYLGGVCSAEDGGTASDLSAHVLSFDPSQIATQGFQTEVEFALDFEREQSAKWASHTQQGHWNPWIDEWSQMTTITHTNGRLLFGQGAQPILSDIEFADDGSMVIAFRDRLGDHMGYKQRPAISGNNSQLYTIEVAGDVIHVCNVAGELVIEGNPGCAINDDAFGDSIDTDGIYNSGEFYYEDRFFRDPGTYDQGHFEIATGSLALLHSRGEVVSTVMDPLFEGGTPAVHSQGLHWYSTQTGLRTNMFEIVPNTQVTGIPNGSPTVAKANGLGDLELLCLAAPLELGNYVWLDANTNGVQDPNEMPIEGVEVVLTDINGSTYTTTTDPNGEYYFNSDNVTGGLLPQSAYTITVDTMQAPLAEYKLTTANADSGTTIADSVDSDGVLVGTQAMITMTTGAPGQNDHTQDFGFSSFVSLGSTLFYDSNDNGLLDMGEEGIPEILIELYDVDNTRVSTTTTDADGNYCFEDLVPGDYRVVVPTPPADAPTSSTPTDDADNQEDDDDNGSQTATGESVTSPVITLAIGEEPADESGQGGDKDDASDSNGDMTIDFGFVPLVSIGSTLFYDNNDNGLQDANEDGVSDIVVELYDAQNTFISTTTTDDDGNYCFADLAPGEYQVVVPEPPADAPISSTSTDTEDNQEDGDDNGTQTSSGERVISPLIMLTPSEEPIGETEPGGTKDDDADAHGDMTVDFGFVPLASLCHTVWSDTDRDGIQDVGEVGIPGVTVHLLDADGVLVQSAVSDSSGCALFESLLPSIYIIETAVDEIYTISAINYDNLRSNDADFETARTGTVVLPPGQHNSSPNIGVYTTPLSLDVMKEPAQLAPSFYLPLIP